MKSQTETWQVDGRTGYILMHHGWRKGEEQFRNQFSFGLQYDHATVSEKDAEEKAAFIVRACNSHDQLVAALKDAIFYADSIVERGLWGEADVARFRAALAAAEGEGA